MFNRVMLRCWAGLALALLAACGSQPIPASPAPAAAAPTAAAVIAPTAAPSQMPEVAPTAGAAQPENPTATIPEGLTPEGYHMLGRPDAPVTLVMYSDFL